MRRFLNNEHVGMAAGISFPFCVRAGISVTHTHSRFMAAILIYGLKSSLKFYSDALPFSKVIVNTQDAKLHGAPV